MTMNTEQLRAGFEALLYKHPYLRELGTLKNPNGDYCDLDIQDCWEFYQAGRAAMQSQDREDAELLRAMAAEWDRARRGVDSYMPIWEALCEAIGNDADGTGMREAIDHARRIEENK